MARPNWRTLGGIDLEQLVEARLQAHYAAQWLARAARAYIPAKPDDSHTNLGWDDMLDGLITHPIREGARLGLNLPELALAIMGPTGRERSQVLHLNGRSDRDVRNWLGEQLGARKLDPGALDAPAPYRIAAHPIAGGAAYSTAAPADALRELAAWFANANASLHRIRSEFAAAGLDASPVRCWPHHFDIATLIALDSGEHGRSVNVGLSPGDEHYAEPYYYVSPYPYPEPARLPTLPALGHWHTKGFTAAIAPASRILALRDPQRETEAFLQEAAKGSLSALQ